MGDKPNGAAGYSDRVKPNRAAGKPQTGGRGILMDEFLRMREAEFNPFEKAKEHFREDSDETRDNELYAIKNNATCKSKKYQAGYLAAAKEAGFKSYWLG